MPKLTSLLFAPSRLPPRGREGYVEHPDMKPLDDEDSWDMLHERFGVEEAEVRMDAESLDRFRRQDDDDCGWWTPASPKGAHWRIAYIFGSDDGPIAHFVRHPQFADRPTMTIKEYFAWNEILASQRRRFEKKIEKLTEIVAKRKGKYR